MTASQQTHTYGHLQLPHYFAAAATLQQQQKHDTGRNPDQNLNGCVIHDLVSFLLK
jgi:hypothetical protein